MEAVLIMNEVVGDLEFRKGGVLCKLYMEKTYNHVSWSFVD